MKDLMRRLLKEESGQGMTEYGLIIALVAIAAIAALIFLGDTFSNTFNEVGNKIENAQ
ncbi:MAG: Flp family type IVb pilin [Heliobacteriaceae bacterium]|nr:Flp family type IVb pilin [Heliobacteriaceae bacterium]MDD4588302.1 Flp family type IVb pilin [Heliobacteriaceae bacterium]